MLGANGGTLDLNGYTVTHATGISGAGALRIAGAGVLTMAAANTYSGQTTIDSGGTLTIDHTLALQNSTLNYASSGGTLRAGAASALSSASAVFINNTTTLDLNGFDQTVKDLDSYNAGTGQFDSGTVLLGGATLTSLTPAVTNNWAGSIQGTGHFVKQGATLMTWTGANTFSGTLTLSAGTLRTDAANTLSPSASVAVASGATLALGHANGVGTSGNVTIGASATLDTAAHGFDLSRLAGSGTATGSGVLAYNSTGDRTLGTVLAGTASLAKSGTGALTLLGANTFTAGTTLLAGTLRAGSAAAFGVGSLRVEAGVLDLAGYALANPIDVRGGSVANLSGFSGTQTVHTNASYSGSVGGALVVANNGSVNSSDATFAGAATVQGGGFVTGTGTFASLAVQAGGTLAPGNSPGLLTISGDLTLLGRSITVMELGGTVRGTSYDAIDVGGTLTFGGALVMSFVDGYTPAAGTSFNLFDWGSATGTFASLSLPSLGAGLTWNTDALYTTGTLGVATSAIPEPSTYAALAGVAVLGLAVWRRRWERGRPRPLLDPMPAGRPRLQ